MAKRGYKLQEFVAHTSDIKCLNIGKKSCRVFVTGGDDHKVNIWPVGKPTPLLSLSGHTSPVESVTFNSVEALVLAGASSGTIKLWDLEEGKIIRTVTGHRSKSTSVEFHPFGEFFASGSQDADLKIWDIRKKGCIHTYKGHTRGIRTIRFTPDGRWIVSGGEDNVIKLWDLTAGKLLHDFKFHNGAIRSIDFHPHEFLLATGSADRTVKFWDLETFELIGSAGPEVSGVRSMTFHPDGKTLFCGLDEKLKVFSWEPIRCHDDVDIGWSTLGDLSIQEGKLLGCSYHHSCIGVWVVDISLIRPYAGDEVPRSDGFVESLFMLGDDGGFEKTESCVKSFSTCLNGGQDQGSDVKEIIHSECTISNDICQKSFGRSGSTKATKAFPRSSAVLRGKKDASIYKEVQTIDYSSKGTSSNVPASSNKPTSREGRNTEMYCGTPRRNEFNSISKGLPLRSSEFCGTGLAKRNKLLDAHSESNAQSNRTGFYSPVVVPRDDPDMHMTDKTGGGPSTSDCDVQNRSIHKPIHSRSLSSVEGGSEMFLSASFRTSSDSDDVADCKFLPDFLINNRNRSTDSANMKLISDKFERVVFLDRSFGTFKEKSEEQPCSSPEAENLVKLVRGVAVQHGRTRSLVESWENRERSNNGGASEISTCLNTITQSDLSINQEEVQNTGHHCEIDMASKMSFNNSHNTQEIRQHFGTEPSSEDNCTKLHYKQRTQKTDPPMGRNLTFEDNDVYPDVLLQNRDIFVNVIKSRLTKLQMVWHCWEQNGVKGTINAVAKLPDHSIQVDIISIFAEKLDLFTLDLFSCLLPLLVGLLGSKTERHTEISLEMLLKLAKLFIPVIKSTISASSVVGVDIQAEQRLDRCRQCYKQLEKTKEFLPSFTRKGGAVSRRAMELNLILHGF